MSEKVRYPVRRIGNTCMICREMATHFKNHGRCTLPGTVRLKPYGLLSKPGWCAQGASADECPPHDQGEYSDA